MRRVLLLVVLVLLGAQLPTSAQTGTLVKLQWDVNPPSENVQSYTLIVDSAAPVSIPPTVVASCTCIEVQRTLALGSHTVKASAVNLLISTDPGSVQEGPILTATFTLNPAGNISNFRVRK